MGFTRTSDDFSDDCWGLSDAAYRLHHEGLTWSGRKLLDCRIPKADLRRFARRPEAVDELIREGFWQDGGDAYLILHHAVYQRTREDTIALQKRNQENGAKGGRPKKGSARREVWETQVGSQVGSEMATQGDRIGKDRDALEEDETKPMVPAQRVIGWDACPQCGCLDPCDCES